MRLVEMLDQTANREKINANNREIKWIQWVFLSWAEVHACTASFHHRFNSFYPSLSLFCSMISKMLKRHALQLNKIHFFYHHISASVCGWFVFYYATWRMHICKIECEPTSSSCESSWNAFVLESFQAQNDHISMTLV